MPPRGDASPKGIFAPFFPRAPWRRVATLHRVPVPFPRLVNSEWLPRRALSILCLENTALCRLLACCQVKQPTAERFEISTATNDEPRARFLSFPLSPSLPSVRVVRLTSFRPPRRRRRAVNCPGNLLPRQRANSRI